MASVTFPSALGGDGNTYTDDSNPSTGLAAGGHRTRFVPALSGSVAMAQSAATSAIKALRRNVLTNASFEVWNDSTGSVSCTAGTRTAGPECWYVDPSGAAVTRQRSTTVKSGNRARYSLEITGAASVTTVRIGQRIEACDIAKIKRAVVFQAAIYNGSGASFQPSLLVGTPAAADNFTTVTNRLTQTLQSCPDATWTVVSHAVDISGYTNVDNGLQVEWQIPSGSLVVGDTVRFMEPMLCPGDTTTDFDFEPVQDTETRCARYYQKSFLRGTAPAQNVGADTGEAQWFPRVAGAGQVGNWITFHVPMRAVPTVTLYNPSAANAQVRNETLPGDCSGSTINNNSTLGFLVTGTGNGSGAVGHLHGVHWIANARLF